MSTSTPDVIAMRPFVPARDFASDIQPWGLTVAYVVDPGGILWHFVQKPG